MSGEHNILRGQKEYSSRKISMPRLVSMFYLRRQVLSTVKQIFFDR